MSTLVAGGRETTSSATYYTMGRKKVRSENTAPTLSTVNVRSLSVPGRRSPPKAIKQEDSPSPERALSAEQATDLQPQLSSHEFERIFNSAYHDFFYFNRISGEAEQAISSQEVDIDEFDRLTLQKQHQRYISLFEGRIIFHEVPNSPHGEVIGHLRRVVERQLDASVLIPMAYNDLTLTSRSKKRPDESYRLSKNRIPNPQPQWLKLLPNNAYGIPYPNIVIEVAVNNESPQKLRDIADRYFSALTSVRVWIAVKIWLKDKKFWVGWGERHPGGTGCKIHSTMDWPPNHSKVATPVNIIYQIPMALVYGPGIQIPAGAPNTLDIDVEQIRRVIAEVIL